MKLYKIFALSLAALAMTACSDNEDVAGVNNAADVTVEMQQQTLSVGEDMQQGVYVKVPVVVTGNPNGNVNISVTVQGTGNAPATEDKDYIISSKRISINPEDKIAYIEFYPTGDEIENENRQFIITIDSAEGAKIGVQSTCIVTLIDNESLLPNAYRDIQGTWHVQTDSGDEFDVNIMGVQEGDDGYLTDLVITGWQEDPDCLPIDATFAYDGSSMTAKVTIPFNQVLGVNWNFTNVGVCDVVLGTVVNGNSLSLSGGTTGTTNTDITRMTFDKPLLGVMFDSATGSFTGRVYFWYDSMTFTKL